MFVHTIKIRLSHTDVTGVIYFAQQLSLGLEAFEAFLASREKALHNMLEAGEYLCPIVHCEADFSTPVKWGELLSFHLSIPKVGTTSFTVETHIQNERKQEVGKTKIVHVCVSKKSGKSIPIPQELLAILAQR